MIERAAWLEESHIPVLTTSLMALLAGIGAAFWLYVFGPRARTPAAPIAPDGSPLAPARVVLENLYYVDRLYDLVLVRPLALVRGVLAWLDANVIDRVVNIAGGIGVVIAKIAGALDYWGVDAAVRGASAATARAGVEARRVQTGRVQEYLYLSLVLFGFIFLVWTVAGSIP